MFELLSKAVVESKQKVNIPKLNKEEPEEKEENEKAKREEERGTSLSNFNHLFHFKCMYVWKTVCFKWMLLQSVPSSHSLTFVQGYCIWTEQSKLFIILLILNWLKSQPSIVHLTTKWNALHLHSTYNCIKTHTVKWNIVVFHVNAGSQQPGKYFSIMKGNEKK